MWCRVGKCCFCINQRVGVTIIACILLVWDAFLLICTSYLAFSSYADQEDVWEEPEVEDTEGAALSVAGASLTMMITTVLFSLAVLLDIMLLVAAITAWHRLLRTWMVAYAVVGILLPFTYRLNMKVFFSGYSGLFFILLYAGLVVYFWIEVRSYYLQLRQKRDAGGLPSAGSKANWLVPTGGALPAHWTFYNTPIRITVPTTSPHYTSSEKAALCHSHDDTEAPGGVC